MKSTVVFYTPFNLPSDWSSSSDIHCSDESLTVQADKDDADINTIVKRFGLTGQLPFGVERPIFDDFTNIPNDYHRAMNFVLAAEDSFMQMPADVRTRFDNDAGKFLDFINADSNYEEAIAMGIAFERPSPDASGDGVSPEVSGDGNKP